MMLPLSPTTLLCRTARERCIANLKELPVLFNKEEIKPKYNASVLVPLCINNEEVCLLYTLRSSNLSNHRGQVSFPGGKMDKDETVYQTALRETEEEIGFSPSNVSIWTEMPVMQGRDKNILITPVVAQLKDFDLQKLKPNFDEVQEIFTVPMAAFCDRNNHAHTTYKKNPLPVYMHENYKIWGITGWITHIFLQCFLPQQEYRPDFLRQRFEVDELLPSKL